MSPIQSMILIIGLFVIVILGIVFSWQFVYSRIKPYLQTKEDRKKLLMGYAIFTLIAICFAVVVRYMQKEPAYFEDGIEQLHTSKYIQGRINKFSSYTFDPVKLTKEPKSPADFQVQINGDSLTLYLTCTMKKTKDNWQLVYIKEDSVTVNRVKD